MVKKKRVLLLIKSESYRAEDFLRAAKLLNLELVVGSDQPSVLEAISPGRVLELDFGAGEGAEAAIVEYHRSRPFDAIVAAEDEGTVLAARIAATLGLRGNPEESVVSARDKGVFREITTAAGLETPWFRTFPLEDDPAEFAGKVPFPCVLKPLFLSGSRGVIRADGEEGFVAAFHRIAAILDDPVIQKKGGPLATRVLVESYLAGPEVAVEGLVRGGVFRPLVVFDKPEPMEGPYFEETIYVTPSRLGEPLQEKILAVVAAGVAALGLRDSPIHAELRVNGGLPALLELAPRSIGGRCGRVLQFGAGKRLEEILLEEALGNKGEDPVWQGGAAGAMMIPIPRGGKLERVEGLPEARGVDGVEGVEIAIPIGQELVPLPEGRRYLGFIFARGKTPEMVEKNLREAHGRLEFTISETL